jgi:hypothetical protein
MRVHKPFRVIVLNKLMMPYMIHNPLSLCNGTTSYEGSQAFSCHRSYAALYGPQSFKALQFLKTE